MTDAETDRLVRLVTELLRDLPRCEHRDATIGDACGAIATHGTNSHTPQWCSEHRRAVGPYGQHYGIRECDWAHAATELDSMLTPRPSLKPCAACGSIARRGGVGCHGDYE